MRSFCACPTDPQEEEDGVDDTTEGVEHALISSLGKVEMMGRSWMAARL